MAATVRILNWNIQNFGPVKSGRKFGNGDITNAIARVVTELNADIFVMLELNTTKDDVAGDIAADMLKALQTFSGGQYPVCVLSANTGLEFYAFFVRDPSVTAPIPVTSGKGVSGIPYVLGAPPELPIADARFTELKASTKGVVDLFPFLTPDLPMTSSYGRNLGIPRWVTSEGKEWRLPVMGLFRVAGASAGNEVLPVVACHFDPRPDTAGMQLELLQYVSLLAELGPGRAAPVKLAITPASGGAISYQTADWVLLGDFNIDQETRGDLYAPVVGGSAPALGASGWLKDDEHTLLILPRDIGRIHDTRRLAYRTIDGLFTRGPVAGTGNASVTDVPFRVMVQGKDRLTIRESVEHYAALDQRGFRNEEESLYREYVYDYARQLGGRTDTFVNIHAGLLGARLISDHLPVLLEVKVP